MLYNNARTYQIIISERGKIGHNYLLQYYPDCFFSSLKQQTTFTSNCYFSLIFLFFQNQITKHVAILILLFAVTLAKYL